MSHTSSSLKEEVVLRGVCRGFHAMFPESHIEHKWRKVLHSHIFVLYQQEFIDDFRDVHEKFVEDDNRDEFWWWVCADRYHNDLMSDRTLQIVTSCVDTFIKSAGLCSPYKLQSTLLPFSKKLLSYSKSHFFLKRYVSATFCNYI